MFSFLNPGRWFEFFRAHQQEYSNGKTSEILSLAVFVAFIVLYDMAIASVRFKSAFYMKNINETKAVVG